MTNPIPKSWRDMPRGAQVLVYTLCYLEQLKWIGFITGGHLKPQAIAMAAFVEMKAEGFRPTPQELRAALEGIDAHFDKTAADAARAHLDQLMTDDQTIDWTEVVAWREAHEEACA